MFKKDTFLQDLTKQYCGQFTAWQKIDAEASTRSYYRCVVGHQRIICVDSKSTPSAMKQWLKLCHVLDKHDVPVPQVLAIDDENHCYWITDHGTTHYHDCFEKISTEIIPHLLKKLRTVKINDRLGHVSVDQASDSYISKSLLYFKEFVVDMIAKERHGADSDAQKAFSDINLDWLQLAYRNAAKGFSHADFHSMNIIIDDNRPVLIDFQDACVKPLAYDTASWLYDFYIELPEQYRQQQFVNMVPIDYPGTPKDWEQEIYACGLLRSMRVWGLFYKLVHQNNLQKYSKYLPVAKQRASFFMSKLTHAKQLSEWTEQYT